MAINQYFLKTRGMRKMVTTGIATVGLLTMFACGPTKAQELPVQGTDTDTSSDSSTKPGAGHAQVSPKDAAGKEGVQAAPGAGMTSKEYINAKIAKTNLAPGSVTNSAIGNLNGVLDEVERMSKFLGRSPEQVEEHKKSAIEYFFQGVDGTQDLGHTYWEATRNITKRHVEREFLALEATINAVGK